MLDKLHNYFLVSQGVSTMNYFKDLTGEGITKFTACVGVSLLNWLMGTFTPIIFVLLLLGLLIITDAILGCKVSIKKNRKCESRRFWKTLRKFGWSCAIVWFASRIDADILISFNAHLSELFAGLIAGVELWSIVENLNTLYPDGPWRILSKVIKSKGEKYLDITVDKEDLPKVKQLVKKIK